MTARQKELKDAGGNIDMERFNQLSTTSLVPAD